MTRHDERDPRIALVPATPDGDGPSGAPSAPPDQEAVTRPNRLLRLASMAQALRAELEHTELDATARQRLASVFNRTLEALREALTDDLRSEFDRVELPLPDEPTEAELHVAHAQLVGWLEGLFHGIRTTVLAHQLATQEELAQAYQQGLETAREEADRATPGRYL